MKTPTPRSNVEKLAHCLTCGGTGRRGNLSGKKKCPKCSGTGRRTVLNAESGSTVLDSEHICSTSSGDEQVTCDDSRCPKVKR